MHSTGQTIFALSSGRPPAAIAVVRLSGPRAAMAVESLAGGLPPARAAQRVMLRDRHGQAIDDALALWFPAPRSATGEDVAEFHIHGGRAVLEALLGALSAIEGLRPAEPGEFTRRAFENGKIDLTAAEGIDDLIHADTDRQRRQALRQMQGVLGEQAEVWRKRIIDAMALVTAAIDFADEADVPAGLLDQALDEAAALRAEIIGVLASSRHGERLREGLVVAIAGPPNAGKSTLLNRLARREAAIVSPYAGTTRDVIEVHLDLDGYPLTLLDTAGLRDTEDPVEQEGIRRARHRAEAADLVLWLTDRGEPPPDFPAPVWVVETKSDADSPPSAGKAARRFRISALGGEGVKDLSVALARFAEDALGATESALITRTRHRQLLEATVEALGAAAVLGDQGEELVAEELRRAADALGRLTGRIDVEDILDVIFREFCIGK